MVSRKEFTENLGLFEVPIFSTASQAFARVRDTLSSILQLFPTGRLYWRNAFSNSGTSLMTQRSTVEWSTLTPRSAIISSRLRRLNA